MDGALQALQKEWQNVLNRSVDYPPIPESSLGTKEQSTIDDLKEAMCTKHIDAGRS
jgi:hypothetical protein